MAYRFLDWKIFSLGLHCVFCWFAQKRERGCHSLHCFHAEASVQMKNRLAILHGLQYRCINWTFSVVPCAICASPMGRLFSFGVAFITFLLELLYKLSLWSNQEVLFFLCRLVIRCSLPGSATSRGRHFQGPKVLAKAFVWGGLVFPVFDAVTVSAPRYLIQLIDDQKQSMMNIYI